jgi:hypothetical protein
VYSLLQWKSNKYYISECVFVASGINHAIRMRRVIVPSVALLALQYFSTLSQNGTIFEKKKFIEHTMCVLIFSTNFVRNISHSKKK